MKCSISNIAWTKEQDTEMYAFLKENGIDGLEIAPSRIFGENPYSHLQEASEWKKRMKQEYGITIVSMQSIWFGRNEKLFASDEERESLTEYTKRAIDFAHVVGCKNLVFGCPRNRKIGELCTREEAHRKAAVLFKDLAEYAARNEAVLALEANPVLYGTDFLNTTQETLDYLDEIESMTGNCRNGLGCNLDFGTIIENQETFDWVFNNRQVKKISHVHISEPGLELIKERGQHRELMRMLFAQDYKDYISIEMKAGRSLEEVKTVVMYVQRILSEIRNEK